MGKMFVHNDGSVRCVCSKRIYEEAFGGEGIDQCNRVLDPNWLKRAKYRAICARPGGGPGYLDMDPFVTGDRIQ